MYSAMTKKTSSITSQAVPSPALEILWSLRAPTGGRFNVVDIQTPTEGCEEGTRHDGAANSGDPRRRIIKESRYPQYLDDVTGAPVLRVSLTAGRGNMLREWRLRSVLRAPYG